VVSGHVGRHPLQDDFLFPDANGVSFRETSSVDFLDDLGRAGCGTTYKGYTLGRYSLRHAFATNARRARIWSEGRDCLLGHTSNAVKSLHYEDADELIADLADEVAKFLLGPSSASILRLT
jgi:hypothetical protein